MFVSHPGDFTPVCTSEIVALARHHEAFASRGCAILAHSTDSLYAHLAWVRMLHDDLNVVVPFPIIEDPDHHIARAWGIATDNNAHAGTVRATWFIDPESVVQAVSYYPAAVGRSVAEMLRLLEGLQRTSGEQVMTPEGWTPGQDVLPPPNVHAAQALDAERPVDWFYHPSPDNE